MAKLSLEATLQSLEEVRTGFPCKTCVIIRGLDKDDRETLVGWIDNPDMKTSMIVRALASYGIRVSASSVSRHRRGHV